MFCAQIHREDSVRLVEIHKVVMTVFNEAATHGGEYDGWETFVEKGDAWNAFAS